MDVSAYRPLTLDPKIGGDSMKALRLHAGKEVRTSGWKAWMFLRPAACGPHEVLLKNSHRGICGTDLHDYTYFI